MSAATKTNPVKDSLEKLKAGVASIQTSDDYKRYLGAMGKFWEYSWRNQFLIAIQCPNARRVAGYRTWQSMGRQVKQGEKAIRILAPMFFKNKDAVTGEDNPSMWFRSVPVFDISQTEGEDLPSVGGNTLLGCAPDRLYETLAEIAADEKITINPEAKLATAYGVWDPTTRVISLKAGESQAQATETLVHELAHALAKHGTKDSDHNRKQAEIVAESVAFIVCDQVGFDVSAQAFPYVAVFSKDMKAFSEVMTDVRRVVSVFMKYLDENTDPNSDDGAADAAGGEVSHD